MRLIMITGGIYLIENFKWIFYLLGALLIFSAYKIVFSDQHEVDFDDNKIIKWLKNYLPFTNQYKGERFMVIEDGKKYFTPLLLVLILVEKTDLVFAMDSIPAILAITQDSFIVFTSNIFAILGLRSLYFLLANIVDRFVYLKYGLGVILAYIGVKMILSVDLFHIPISISLAVIMASLLISIGVSWVVTLKR
jgi:tellurite resistance protein TerC